MNDTPLDAIRAYLDGFNAGDVDAMTAVFSESGHILDGMAPHAWVGPTAARDWYRDVLVEGEHVGAANYHVTVDDPLHHAITGNSAYVVLPAAMTFDLDGRSHRQTGAHFTVALRREFGDWRIAARAWTKGHV